MCSQTKEAFAQKWDIGVNEITDADWKSYLKTLNPKHAAVVTRVVDPLTSTIERFKAKRLAANRVFQERVNTMTRVMMGISVDTYVLRGILDQSVHSKELSAPARGLMVAQQALIASWLLATSTKTVKYNQWLSPGLAKLV